MGEWAVITGASGGLGRGFAERLASDGLDLILVARSVGVLEELATELRSRHHVQVDVLPCDLSDAEARAALVADLAERDIEVLVNNAGFGTVGDFVGADPARVTEEVTLNVLALTELTRAVTPGMVARGRGAVVNVASTAAFQALPGMGVYAATKTYVLSFSQALWAELRPAGVTVLALCPGPTETRFFSYAGDDGMLSRRRTVDDVIDTCFDALAAGKPYVIDGLYNNLLALVSYVAPTRIRIPVAARMLGRSKA